MPSLYNDGELVLPYVVRAYYRAGTYEGSSVKPIPFGLRMLAGDAGATSPQPANVAGFQCRDDSGNTVPKQSLPPRCEAGDFLEASVVFPNCWDGTNLDSADHRSHMAYARADAGCDSAHPVRIPQLTFAQRYPVDAARGTVTLAGMNSATTLHADYIDAWSPAMMAALVENCIHAGIACESITDDRLPPGMEEPQDPPSGSATRADAGGLAGSGQERAPAGACERPAAGAVLAAPFQLTGSTPGGEIGPCGCGGTSCCSPSRSDSS